MFLNNPVYWQRGGYFEVSIGGKTNESFSITNEVYESGWIFKPKLPEEKSIIKKILDKFK